MPACLRMAFARCRDMMVVTRGRDLPAMGLGRCRVTHWFAKNLIFTALVQVKERL